MKRNGKLATIRTTTTTLTHVDHEVLIRIVQNLNAKDIFALERVNRRIYHLIRTLFWPQCRVIAFHSSPGMPLNPLSILRFPDAEEIINEDDSTISIALKITSQKIATILQRCGSALRVLDLRTWIRLGQVAKAENLLSVRDVALLLPSLAAYSNRLNTLDLGFIPLDGQVLVGIANAVGGTLQALRLGCCFQCTLIELNPDVDELFVYTEPQLSAAEFTQFCSASPALLELDISGCTITFERANIDFSTLPIQLRALKTFETELSTAQLHQIAQRAQALRLLHVTVTRYAFDTDPYAEWQQFIRALSPCLETLWLHLIAIPINFPMPLPLNEAIIKNIRTLRICSDGNAETLCPMFGAPTDCFHALQELAISGHHHFQCAHQFRPHCFAPHLWPNLTILHLSYWDELNDQNFGRLASGLRNIQEVRTLFCPHVTWLSFREFLCHCPQVRVFEGISQMTDDLLECVSETMEMRRQQTSSSNSNNAQTILSKFYFIRYQPENVINPEALEGWVEMHEQIAARGSSQNMHPDIVFKEEQKQPAMIYQWGRFWPTQAEL